ncbi:hypothetical protein ACVWXN_008530 [Bradyrhizobium sp. i1.4.4]
MGQSSITLAVATSLTLLDIAMATAANILSDGPMAVDNCFPHVAAGSAIYAGERADIRILTKDEAERFWSYHQFGCADSPTSTVYV